MSRPATFNCRHFFLTYPRCPLPANVLLDHLKGLSTPRGIALSPTFIRVARELHEDGYPHLHALLCLPQSYRASATFFDLQGYHPNIQGARSINDVKTYLEKGGEFIDYGTSPVSAVKRTYGDLLSQATCKGEFWSLVLQNHPRDAVMNMDRIMSFADHHFKPPPITYEPEFTNFIVPEQLSDWHAGNLVGPFERGQRRISLILISPSRYGKTEWARSLGPHLYFNGMFDLSLFRNDVSYAVFDDFAWDAFVKFHKCWLGCQREFTLTDKYRRKQTVLWGKPSIFLCNDDNVPPSSDWILANCLYVRLDGPLF